MVFGEPPAGVDTWKDVARDVSSGALGYKDLQRLDKAQLVSGTLTVDDMVAYLGSEAPGDEELDRIRVLQSRVGLLDARAVEFLTGLLWERLRSLSFEPGEAYSVCLLMEIVLQTAGTIDTSLNGYIAAALLDGGDPQNWARFSYLLLKTGWRLP